jgi:phosphoadenosine phosphosulfate reductase
MSLLSDTMSALKSARSISSSALVAYSDGKDSRVVMDLACRTFDHVEGFFMYYVPGLEFLENGLEEAHKRWGVKIHQYPHWSSLNALKYGVFCDAPSERDSLPDLKVFDIYACAMVETGIPIILTGAKRADSGWRRRYMNQNDRREVINPLAQWTRFDVLAYLRAHGIPLPHQSGTISSGIDLMSRELLWMYDNYPKDFAKFCEYFPYAMAVIKRREFYGTGASGGPAR